MEGELFKLVYETVMNLATVISLKRATFTDAEIVLTYFWAVIHDRPVSWACSSRNWPLHYRRRKLPTPSTMSRRLRRPEIQQLFETIEQSLIQRRPPSLCRWIDAKPLVIGGFTKDKDAANGYAINGYARGYKLYAMADESQGFVHWAVYPMNHCEGTVAKELLAQAQGPGYLVGDGQYDKNHLFDLAADKDIQLVASRRRRNAKALGHRKHSAYRLRSLEMVAQPFGQGLIASRDGIERMFGHLVCFGCGLASLPHWVRTLPRVRRWVRGKIILYQLWRLNLAPAETG